MSNESALIAQIGRTIGLWGDLKFHLHTDFPEQFQAGKTYHTNNGALTISEINFKRGIIRFIGYESIDSAKRLTNTKLFANEAQTKESCELKKGQYFWFDLIGCEIKENDIVMGKVEDIQRIGDTDYFIIETDVNLTKEGFSKNFLIPYIPQYVLSIDIENKIIQSKDAHSILEAS